MDSIELVKLLHQEKEKGLSCLYDRYAPALNGIIARIVLSEALAEEVLQQTFLKIAYSIATYDAASCSLFTWMSRIARQEALNASPSNGERVIQPSTGEPSQVLASNLSAEQKAVLDRIYLLGYTPKETAQQLDIPEEVVKSRLRLAVNKMRQVIQNDPALLLNKALFITLTLTAVS